MSFDFGTANKAQKEAIITTEGPLLIIAGPGTGKTFTLVKRVQYLITEKHVLPEQIMVVTFTEKAAKELVTRISNTLLKSHINVNLSDMQVGTFHSVFGKILADHVEKTGLQNNYVQLDEAMQLDLIARHVDRFKKLPHYDALTSCKWTKKTRFGEQPRTSREIAAQIAKMVDSYREELVSADELMKSKELKVIAVGEILTCYEELLAEMNSLDFSGILVRTYRLLADHSDIRQELSEQYRYLLVDEYQDTNYVQEQIMMLLAGEEKNLCVVGDDDQSLYRFRGATIGNILHFPKLFPGKPGKLIKLEENYRSASQIIDFYNQWMDDKSADGGAKARGLVWGKARYPKTIRRGDGKDNLQTVARIFGYRGKAWYEAIYRLISGLKQDGQITDYNQVAFLTGAANSFGVPVYLDMIKYLEEKGIPIYAPRFGMFFLRQEIREIIGCLFLCCPDSLQQDILDDTYVPKTMKDYYRNCISLAEAISKGKPLGTWIAEKQKTLNTLKTDAHFGLSDMVYQMLAFPPFSAYVDTETGAGTAAGSVMRERAARNIAHLLEMISYYEMTRNMTDGFTPKNYRKNLDDFFRFFLRYRKEENTFEYEDDAEYAPSGCVSFMTIHQSKGMEFPAVIVDLAGGEPWGGADAFTEEHIRPFMHGTIVEAKNEFARNDFWRKYYTAFSRAENLLVLTIEEDKKTADFQFKEMYDALPQADTLSFAGITFKPIKDVDLKHTYSFTTHLGVYDTCPRQYLFFRKLGFTPCRTGNTLFGTLVHETIEDINKAAIAGNTAQITPANIEKWFSSNYINVKLNVAKNLSLNHDLPL